MSDRNRQAELKVYNDIIQRGFNVNIRERVNDKSSKSDIWGELNISVKQGKRSRLAGNVGQKEVHEFLQKHNMTMPEFVHYLLLKGNLKSDSYHSPELIALVWHNGKHRKGVYYDKNEPEIRYYHKDDIKPENIYYKIYETKKRNSDIPAYTIELEDIITKPFYIQNNPSREHCTIK